MKQFLLLLNVFAYMTSNIYVATNNILNNEDNSLCLQRQTVKHIIHTVNTFLGNYNLKSECSF